MNRRTRLLAEEDLVSVAALLARAFGGAHISGADVDALRWKYLMPGPLGDGARAFVVEQDGRIVAHAGFTTAVFSSATKAPITSLTVIDWAADAELPGVGIVLYSHVIRRAETAFLIGGAEVTRAIVPKLGFRPFAEAAIYARWVRPWREFWIREKSLRAVERLGHGVLHRLRSPSPRPGPWRAVKVDAFDARIDGTLAFRPRLRTVCQRTLGSLNHKLACPVVRTEGYLLQDDRRVRGYVVIAYVGWEARVVDINIDSEDPDDWTAAYGAAAARASLDPHVCRVRAMAAVAFQERSLERNGFWVNHREPLSLFDPRARAPEPPIDLQFFESDLAFV